MKKDHAEEIKKNAYWLENMIDFFFDGHDFVTTYEKTLNDLKPEDLQRVAKDLLKQNNLVKVIIRHSEDVN